MFQIDSYIDKLHQFLTEEFGGRLVYLGLQGSYLRNEQNEGSDIDIMAVIDEINVRDLEKYREILMRVGNYEKSCGFICGKEELSHWNPLEACHLLHTTKDLYGSLSELLPDYTQEDSKKFVMLSIGNLYHEIGHRFIHADREKNRAALPRSYKAVFFILQNLTFLKTGMFYETKAELLDALEGMDKEVLKMLVSLNDRKDYEFDKAFDLLFLWCKQALMESDAILAV